MHRRKCKKCGKVRECVTHKDGSINNTKLVCRSCNKKINKLWYDEHSEYKKIYAKEYYVGNKEWLDYVRKNLHKMTPEEKLDFLFRQNEI